MSVSVGRDGSLVYRPGPARKPLPLDELKRLYVDEEMPPDQIGKLYGVSGATVRIRLKEAGVPMHSKGHKGEKNSNWKGGWTAVKFAWLDKEKCQPCVDCGRSYPSSIMQFDHVPERGPKLFEVNTRAARGWRTLEALKAERIKCDLVCPTCHALRTLGRQQCSA